jgi:hypothetical protein
MSCLAKLLMLTLRGAAERRKSVAGVRIAGNESSNLSLSIQTLSESDV